MKDIYKRDGVQVLELVDRYFVDLFEGKKRNTWRYQEQITEPGFLVFEASNNPNLLALVWADDVAYVPLKNVHEVLGGEKISHEELLSGMRKHYPDIELDSEVMIVKHLSPTETYKRHGIPSSLKNIFGADYIKKVEKYA